MTTLMSYVRLSISISDYGNGGHVHVLALQHLQSNKSCRFRDPFSAKLFKRGWGQEANTKESLGERKFLSLGPLFLGIL